MKRELLKNKFVIGDVHGCYHTLLKLIKQLPKDSELIFVGDLCDKGNYSKEVIEFVIENQWQVVKGNHDALMEKHLMEALAGKRDVPWSYDKRFGGLECIANYEEDKALAQKHVDWIAQLPLYLEFGDYFITHGFAMEFYEHKDNESHKSLLFTNRYIPKMPIKENKHKKINLFGHSVVDDVIIHEDFYALDTGCAYGRKLTALSLEDRSLYQEFMDSRDSNYSVRELTAKVFNVEEEPFEILKSLIINEKFPYFDYDIISNEILFCIVEKYGEKGKKELIKMVRREQVFPKQAKLILGEAYEIYERKVK
ncbi:MAG: Serine/threonine protein phosphatase [uncultured Sulfurovum sp.]|uniref:Serine/threonine protein phosphatase n=1 Tax=uncultured Sulfurovum sp. TaxID=269237 RepID=A0A6S6SNF8_9BACT|nr:MAG: Serine/threonine protein phosphatase [uncultured Sulfurovum sp.]